MKRFYKPIIFIIAVVVALSVIAPVQASAASVGGVEITSKGAVVIDFETGITLYGYNENTQRAPASMIKVLAAYVIYDAAKAGEISLDTSVRISKSISENVGKLQKLGYADMPLPEGSSFKIRQLMEIVLVRSACTATIAMGEALCKTEKAFIARMKDKASQLGVETRLSDCWGGSADNRISPLGMAKVTRGFISEHPEVLEITSKKSITFNGVKYTSTNELLGDYSGADGFKTGYTDPAGNCFTGTAKRGERRIISVTMGSSTGKTRFADSRALLNYGFSVADKMVADYYKTIFANPSSANLILDGEGMPLSAYLINDSHYFKLRDIAFLLSGTDVQYDVMWNSEDNSVVLTSGLPYSSIGGELSLPFEGARPYKPTSSKIFYDGEEYEFEAYFIDDYNYFKLRDIGALMGFEVDWENETRTVIINTVPADAGQTVDDPGDIGSEDAIPEIADPAIIDDDSFPKAA